MDRRTFLVGAGTALAGLSGCVGGGSDEREPSASPTGRATDASPTRRATDDETASEAASLSADRDGYPSASSIESTPEPREIDTGSFGAVTTNGVEVPLVPVDVAYYWHQLREARFADARGEGQYEDSHITGAVLSSASGRENDPAADWPKDDRIVTYCGCPHHLSSIRAATFISNGYEEVYAIDEGFYRWRDTGYPTTGSDSDDASYVIRGRTDASDAGEYAWATHRASDQQEAGPIRSDGSFELTLHFSGLSPSAPIHLRTPSYELTAPLSGLTASVVDGSWR